LQTFSRRLISQSHQLQSRQFTSLTSPTFTASYKPLLPLAAPKRQFATLEKFSKYDAQKPHGTKPQYESSASVFAKKHQQSGKGEVNPFDAPKLSRKAPPCDEIYRELPGLKAIVSNTPKYPIGSVAHKTQ
jgi:hypothetical protein